MQKKDSIIPALVGLGIIILVLGVIGYFVIRAFTGDEIEEELPPAESPVTVISDQRAVRMHVRGPVVAAEEHIEYEITVSNDSREIGVYQGYDGSNLIRKVDYSNSPQAYAEFVYALERQGLGETREVTDEEAEPTGACPTGRVYTFTILEGTREVDSWWSGSCSRVGTIDGRASSIAELFNKQIPEYRDLLRGFRL